jgi:chromosome partitioning protein
MKKIAFCNQKGGVAKTTSAINIAAYLALYGKETLLIDLDPQANATSGVGINKRELTQSVYNVLHEHIPIDSAIVSTDIEKLKIIPSSINLTGAEVELVNVMGREYRLRKALQEMQTKFDFVIFDCPPSLGLLTINGLTAATSVIIPIQCEYYALEGLSQLMQTLDLIRDNLNENLEIEGVLMTLADYRTNLTKEVISEVQKHFGKKVYNSVIPRTVKLTEAPGFGKPIALYDPSSIGAKKYEEAVKEILGLGSSTETEEKGSVENVCAETVLNKGVELNGNEKC